MNWDENRKRSMAEDWLYKYEDKDDKSNFRSPYLKQWMLKEYDCATIGDLKRWVKHG